jgi:hypothetical protein
MEPDELRMESILALGRIPDDTEEGRHALESAARSWLYALGQQKWPRCLQYFENASYLSGNHLTRFFYTAEAGFGYLHHGVHDESEFDNLIAKSADNRLIRPTETVVAMLTQTDPMPRVLANSTLPEDEDAAELSKIVINLLWEKPLCLPRKIREIAMVGALCGTGCIEIEYGETDVPVVVPRTKLVRRKNPLFGNPDEPKEVKVEVEDEPGVEMRKDIMARVWTPFHITPDPAATCADDMSWVARSTFEDVEWVKENYDKPDDPRYFTDRLEGIGQDAATNHVLYWWARMQDIIESPQANYAGGGLTPQIFGNASGGYAPGQCIFTVIDVKPSRQYPMGRTLIFASGQLIFAGQARAWSEKYPWRWHPYAFWGWFKLPGRFWAIPLLSELVPLQKKVNAIDCLVHANRQHMSIGQWKLPKHCKVPEGMPSGLPAENLRYTALPGMPEPERVQHQPLPQELLQERVDLLEGIDYIAASGMVANNISKSAARSGVILDFLRQEKLRSKSPMLKEFEEFLEVIGQNILIEIQLNLEDEDEALSARVQTAAREHSSLTVDSFVGASLRDHHAVKLDIASELLHSPEAKQAKALEYMQASGGQVNPEEREAIQRIIGLDQFVRSQENASVSRARRIISRIVNGQIDDLAPAKVVTLIMRGIDVPQAVLPIFQREILSDRFHDHTEEMKLALIALFEEYARMVQEEKEQMFKMQMAMIQAGAAKAPKRDEGGE